MINACMHARLAWRRAAGRPASRVIRGGPTRRVRAGAATRALPGRPPSCMHCWGPDETMHRRAGRWSYPASQAKCSHLRRLGYQGCSTTVVRTNVVQVHGGAERACRGLSVPAGRGRGERKRRTLSYSGRDIEPQRHRGGLLQGCHGPWRAAEHADRAASRWRGGGPQGVQIASTLQGRPVKRGYEQCTEAESAQEARRRAEGA